MRKKLLSVVMAGAMASVSAPSYAATDFAGTDAAFYTDFLTYLQAQLTYTGSLSTLLDQMGASNFAGWDAFQDASANLRTVLARMVSAG